MNNKTALKPSYVRRTNQRIILIISKVLRSNKLKPQLITFGSLELFNFTMMKIHTKKLQKIGYKLGANQNVNLILYLVVTTQLYILLFIILNIFQELSNNTIVD